jgi:hypothetical protein
MKAIDFVKKEIELRDEVLQAIKGTLKALDQKEIHMEHHELNCPCINPGAPEHDLHTVSSVSLDEDGQLSFYIDDQQSCYYTSEIPLEAAIELLGQIEDLDDEDFNLNNILP